MNAIRKSHDIVLPEVKKPAGYGKLIAVLATDKDIRELWFQNDTTVRVIRISAPSATLDDPKVILTTGKRAPRKQT